MEGLAGFSVRAVKGLLRAVLGSRAALRLAELAGARHGTVFMLHRFSDPATGDPGAAPAELRRALAMLRGRGVTLMPLRELARRVQTAEELPGPTVALTVDDGYRDFADVALPVFAEFDCPVTLFLVSEFIGGRTWCWWDRIWYAFRASRLPVLAADFGGRAHRYPLTDDATRRSGAEAFIEALKWVPDRERRRVVDDIGALADVDLPALPPPPLAAITWDEVRRMEGRGVEFGPHTRTHPILARVDDAAAREEIAGSWDDVRRECRDPVPVFCYPNGTFGSYGERDMRIIEDCGMVAAVAVYGGYIDPVRTAPGDRYRLPRFPWPDHGVTAVYQASGLARTERVPPPRTAVGW